MNDCGWFSLIKASVINTFLILQLQVLARRSRLPLRLSLRHPGKKIVIIKWHFLCLAILRPLSCLEAKLIEQGWVHKKKQTQVAPKVPGWHHKSAKIFRQAMQGIGLMTSQLQIFRARPILLACVVPKFILLFTTSGWSAQTYSLNLNLKASIEA